MRRLSGLRAYIFIGGKTFGRSGTICCRHTKGTGETHAWAEFYDDGIWVGIDPTNHRMCDETYLALSHGRDFADCGINRGLFIGGGTQTQSIVATVEEI